MDLLQALRFSFDDENWLVKLIPLAFFSLFALIPLLGLLPLALIFGFMLQLATHVRDGLSDPLPDWTDFDIKLTLGGRLLLAVILYNLPTLLLTSCGYTLVTGIGSGLLGDFTGILTVICVVPFVLIYTIIAWTVLATAITEYLKTNDHRMFFRPAHVWDVMQARPRLIRQWAIYATLVNLLLLVGVVIPCIGWSLTLLLAIPIHGHLLGQFAHQLRRKQVAS